MILIEEGAATPLENALLRSMFEARKRVFVDLLKWDVPVVEGRYERFDELARELAGLNVDVIVLATSAAVPLPWVTTRRMRVFSWASTAGARGWTTCSPAPTSS